MMSEELKLDRYEVTEGGGTFKCPGGEMVYYSDVKSFIADNNAALRAELATFKAGQGKAVAYVLFRDGAVCYEADDNIVISNVPGDETDLYKWRPVYTAPPASADAVSVPREMAARLCSTDNHVRQTARRELRNMLAAQGVKS